MAASTPLSLPLFARGMVAKGLIALSDAYSLLRVVYLALLEIELPMELQPEQPGQRTSSHKLQPGGGLSQSDGAGADAA